jgi:hypothetical protein
MVVFVLFPVAGAGVDRTIFYRLDYLVIVLNAHSVGVGGGVGVVEFGFVVVFVVEFVVELVLVEFPVVEFPVVVEFVFVEFAVEFGVVTVGVVVVVVFALVALVELEPVRFVLGVPVIGTAMMELFVFVGYSTLF